MIATRRHMKKFFTICVIFLVFGILSNPVCANEPETITLKGEAVFDWLDMSQIERDTIIQNYKNIIFDDNTVYKYKKNDFKELHKDYVKDQAFKTHYNEAKEGITETANYRLSAFYNGSVLISYAIQYKNNPKTVYYYDGFGNLRYVDKIEGNYPDFPYWSKQ